MGWVTRDGRQVSFKKMTLSHLKNALNHAETPEMRRKLEKEIKKRFKRNYMT